MSCDGFDHGSRVRLLEDLMHEGRSFDRGIMGTVWKVDRARHTIDVNLDSFGLTVNLPAHKFGPVFGAR